MTAVGRVVGIALLTLATGACLLRSSGPDENRAEAFDFTPVAVDRQEAVEAFRSLFLSTPAILDEGTVTPIGKFETAAGSIIFADFQVTDPESGRQRCSGSATPTGGGWGCGPLETSDQIEGFPQEPVTLSASGPSGTWSDVHLRVNEDVAYLTAVAEDGTSYRMEPIAGNAWMEWKPSHGDLRITAFDSNDNPLGSVHAPGS